MSRRLLAINALLVVISLVSVGVIVKHLATSHTVSAPRSRPAAGATAPGPTTEEPRPPAQAYNVIASRNLFNPTRSESAVAATPGGPALNIVKPNLHGVVLRDGSPIAYLEDPQTKRIAGYRRSDRRRHRPDDLRRCRRDRAAGRHGRRAAARPVQAAPATRGSAASTRPWSAAGSGRAGSGPRSAAHAGLDTAAHVRSATHAGAHAGGAGHATAAQPGLTESALRKALAEPRPPLATAAGRRARAAAAAIA